MRLEISSLATKHIYKKQKKKKPTILPPKPTQNEPSNQLANQFINCFKTEIKEFLNIVNKHSE